MDDISQNTGEVLKPIGEKLSQINLNSLENLFVGRLYSKKRKKMERETTIIGDKNSYFQNRDEEKKGKQ